MEVYICKTVDDFHQCQLELFQSGYKWHAPELCKDYGYFNLYNMKYLGLPTYQIYTEGKIIIGWDDESHISHKCTKIIKFQNREQKLRRILNGKI